jgi:hypothetical protein
MPIRFNGVLDPKSASLYGLGMLVRERSKVTMCRITRR